VNAIPPERNPLNLSPETWARVSAHIVHPSPSTDPRSIAATILLHACVGACGFVPGPNGKPQAANFTQLIDAALRLLQRVEESDQMWREAGMEPPRG
jgi:hypothetical protein